MVFKINALSLCFKLTSINFTFTNFTDNFSSESYNIPRSNKTGLRSLFTIFLPFLKDYLGDGLGFGALGDGLGLGALGDGLGFGALGDGIGFGTLGDGLGFDAGL